MYKPISLPGSRVLALEDPVSDEVDCLLLGLSESIKESVLFCLLAGSGFPSYDIIVSQQQQQ